MRARGEFGRAAVVEALRGADALRAARRPAGEPADDVGGEIEQATCPRGSPSDAASLRPVINATGVILHTNLGRAPLARAAVDASPRSAGYTNLEYDLERRRGRRDVHAERPDLPPHRRRGRGRRQQQRRRDAAHARGARRRPRGDRLARRAGRDRRRVPRARRDGAVGRDPARGRHDQSHARRGLRRGDRRAHGAAILRVHPSNFRIEGSPSGRRSRSWPRSAAVQHPASIEDHRQRMLGAAAGAASATSRRRDEHAAGADLVLFSGDKLLGGPQARIIAGTARPRRGIRAPSADARAARRQDDACRARDHARQNTPRRRRAARPHPGQRG